jgi:hypothetical protein
MVLGEGNHKRRSVTEPNEVEDEKEPTLVEVYH